MLMVSITALLGFNAMILVMVYPASSISLSYVHIIRINHAVFGKSGNYWVTMFLVWH